MKIKNIYFTILFGICSFFLNAQTVKDSINLSIPVKFNLYKSFEERKVKTSTNKEVTLLNYLKSNRKFNDKPTLILTWFTFDHSGKKIIDSLIANNTYKKYNIVIINRNAKKFYEKNSEFIIKTSNENPLYAKYLISLFDFQSDLSFKDREATPMLFWLDKDLNIVTSTVTNEITINKIENILSLIDSKEIIPSHTKYFSNRLIPSLENEATFKQIITESDGITNIKLNIISTNEVAYDFNFTKSKQGHYYFKDNTYVKKKPFSPYKAEDFPINRTTGLTDRASNLYGIKSNYTLIYFCDINSPESKERLENLQRLFRKSNNTENTNNYKSLYLDVIVVFIGEDSKFENNNKFEPNSESQKMANYLTQEFYKVFDNNKVIQNKFEKNSSGSFHLLDSNKNVIYESEDVSYFYLVIESKIQKK